ncbi:MAG: ABC transporter ATP-binding protein [Oscillospiraceae bacterium]|nr:ABC transporter ATP-binding protein [Oscillospiraceae bacterium]
MDRIIEVEGLHKSYGDIKAVNGLDFYVEKGKLFAFLGPNGAGKSTTIDMICTFLKPDSGSVTVDGYALGRDDTEIRKIIGAVFQDGVLDELLTVGENLRVRGGFYGLKGRKLKEAVSRTAEQTGITELLGRPYGKLSGGQRRRCDIARALINTPKILFLDEPTTGLDPQTRKYVWDTISGIREKNDMTVFLTTHYMEEAADADYVIVIDKGEISARGTPSELKEKFSYDRLVISSHRTVELEERLTCSGLACSAVADTVTVPLSSTLDSLPIIESCRDLIESFEVIKGTMDDAFITITGKELRE